MTIKAMTDKEIYAKLERQFLDDRLFELEGFKALEEKLLHIEETTRTKAQTEKLVKVQRVISNLDNLTKLISKKLKLN